MGAWGREGRTAYQITNWGGIVRGGGGGGAGLGVGGKRGGGSGGGRGGACQQFFSAGPTRQERRPFPINPCSFHVCGSKPPSGLESLTQDMWESQAQLAHSSPRRAGGPRTLRVNSSTVAGRKTRMPMELLSLY